MTKKLIMTACVLLSAYSLTACEKAPVGSVGIKVSNFGGDQGVKDEVLGV